ncbi:Transposase MuDR plant [Arabidopsis thaliana x Arabidopsis arenosa]|uniref:Transposase MuDR plant n=1 Tax=Arabidopsis thaliana x Arabidopsis arenosa TaxID=1240361 RepID=A0A8T2BME5_9BRAS|nr:Transposase MuDR plant [Arabidopsis thaliana x Arabidopsis arenosa]
MAESVTLILGEWTCTNTGEWRFVVQNGEMARCVAVGKDTSFKDLEGKVERVFGVNRKEMRFDLSFWCPVETTVFTQTKMPPVLVKSDEEYALFKGRSKDNGGLHMYVTMKKVGREIEAPMEEVDKFGCGNELYEIDIAEDEEMISDTQLLAYVEEIEAVHKSRMVEEGQHQIEDGLVDINIGNENIIGRQAGNVQGSEKGKEIVVLEDNAMNVDNNLKDGNEEIPPDTSSVSDEELDYNFDEWTARINRDYPLDWDPYNGGAVKDVEDTALGDTCERGIFEVGGPSGEREREVGEQFRERLAMIDEIVPIGFSLGLEESWDVEKEVEIFGGQQVSEEGLVDISIGKVGGLQLSEEGVVDTSLGRVGGQHISEEGLVDISIGKVGGLQLSEEGVVDTSLGRVGGQHMSEEGLVDISIGRVGGQQLSEEGLVDISIEGQTSHGKQIVVLDENAIIDDAYVDNPMIEDVVEQPIISSFMEEDLLGVIDINDPLLLNDAPPVHDNMRGAPSDERNMDLKRAGDAIYVGRVFANKAELHKFLSVYAMQRLFSFRVLKSDKGRAIVRCVDKKCDWRIYATNHENSENLEIRTVRLRHTCDVSYRSRYSEKATAKILADLVSSKYANGKKGPRACELPEMVLAELNVTISYMKAWNTKELAIAAARGNEEESYKFLATYLHLVKSTNPGTITEMHTSKDNKGNTLFKYLFFAFGASIEGYQYLRKVIVIDGTAMKGKYKGCLVAASGQDGNMQIFPLAFAVVDGENEGGWVWFFKNLARFVPDCEDLVFVSDRHASIYSALRIVYPLAQHAACAVHLFRNVKHKFHCEGLAGIVSKAARAFTVGDFRWWWREIERRKPTCAKYLMNIGLPHWTLSHFPGMRYNVMSSNISESLNAALQKAVDYPIVSMVEFIRAMLMRWFWCRRTVARKATSRCTPEIEELLIDHFKESVDCAVLSASDWIYQVNDGNGIVFTVDLEKKTCTCRVFDVLLVPCSHALAARKVRNLDIYTLVGECYFVEPWRKKYERVVMPVPKERDSDVPEEIQEVDMNPPKTRRGGGRPRKVRIPSQGERHGVKTKRVTKCGRCGKAGHNRKTCSTLI